MDKKQNHSRHVCLILDNIRSVHNVGSIFRTAETIGVEKIYLLGTSPMPKDRFGNKRKDFAKVALGAEELVSWEYIPDEKECFKLLQTLKRDGFEIVSLEQNREAVDYRSIGGLVGDKVVVVVGNEVGGISQNLLSASKYIAEIPLCGKKESLNVSVATGIFLFANFS